MKRLNFSLQLLLLSFLVQAQDTIRSVQFFILENKDTLIQTTTRINQQISFTSTQYKVDTVRKKYVLPIPVTGKTFNLTFGTLTGDFPRVGAGAGQWGNAYEAAGVPQSPDRYDRMTWYQLEPTKGDFSFSQLKARINAAIDKGQKYQFGGVMTVCPGCDVGWTFTYNNGKAAVPAWLLQLTTGSRIVNGTWVPDYNSESYLSELFILLSNINYMIQTGSYKGIPYKYVVDEIDIRGYGSWGEWNRVNADGPPYATASTLKRIVQIHLDAFPEIQLNAMIAAYDGGRIGILNIPAEVGYFILKATNKVGRIGQRRDSYTDDSPYLHDLLENNPVEYNGERFKDLINNLWKSAPLRGESVCGGPVDILASQVKFYKTGSFGNGNFCLGTLTTAHKTAIAAAAAAAGYRISISNARVTTGQQLKIEVDWNNIDRPPTYANWTVSYSIGPWTGTSAFNPRLFTGTTTTTDQFTMPSLPAGTYQLKIRISDPNGYMQPLPLANSGRATDGTYTATGTISIP